MLERVVTIITLVSLCLLAVIINAANPTGVGPFGILAFFALSYLSLFGLVAYLIFNLNRVISNLSSVFMIKKPVSLMSFKKSSYYSSVISAGPVILVGIRTVGNVGIYEVLLTILFVGVGCVYIARRTS